MHCTRFAAPALVAGALLTTTLATLPGRAHAADDHAAHENAVDENPAPPNILFIWADNLGYGDLGLYGSERVKTPVIDRLAADGMRFEQFYVAHTVCSPSRAALLTGRQPFRTGVTDVLRPDSPTGLAADEITIAEALREQGYATCAIGKWHVGDQREYLPLAQGFDHYFGIPWSMDMRPTLLLRDNEIVEDLQGDKVNNITERYVDETIEWIGKHREKPFFVYFNHTLPHPPINLPEEFRTPDRPIYDDAIEQIDRQTGRLLDALRKMGLEKNTLVIFTSDNGPMHADGSAGKLRGRIRDAYEGGVRVPFVARWPGRIARGGVVDSPAIMYDVFPTLVDLAGAELPDDRIYDGRSLRALLLGEALDAVRRRDPFVWVYDDNVTALRDGRWKLHIASRDKTLAKPELYDLERDPGESRSIAEEHPDVARKLTAYAEEFQKQVPKVWTLKYPVRDPAKRPSGVRRE
ncbi:MAG: sulfatase [Pirellulaceae bacterium]